MKKKVVLHSGGMDSSICLAKTIAEFGKDNVVAVGFDFGQRHKSELQAAKKIASDWGVVRKEWVIEPFSFWKTSALIDKSKPIYEIEGKPPSTFVLGRNGIFLHLAGGLAWQEGADAIVIGVMGLDHANSRYPDCSRHYIDLMEQIVRIDLGQPDFQILTPLVNIDKYESLILAEKLGVLSYLLDNTITCYEGISKTGCKKCPSCHLRNDAIKKFLSSGHQASLPDWVKTLS